MRNAHKILIGKQEVKRQLIKRRRRLDANTKIDFWPEEIACEDTNWIHLAQERVQRQSPPNMVRNLHFPQKADLLTYLPSTVLFLGVC